ncbi:unnamed protein product [Orchesella dallaii]|uniref:histone acetyltransferase n=1 Tax=Orchesella dallaii TaxID=48710 RepID=A0ABP1PSD9_9HEXA
MMKVGPHVITHSHCSVMHNHDNREMVPRVGTPQAGGNLKLIQCQLMLLLHARRCQQRRELMISSNRQSNVTNNVARAILLNCPIRHCRAMKEVLDHMKKCQLGAVCTFQHCTTSLRILSHWTNCTVVDCPLCQCVRQRMRRAKEWEATLPRSSRYTLLAAALRSSQTPRPVPPNCHVAEQAEEGQSGVPCQGQDELRPCPTNQLDGNGTSAQRQQQEQQGKSIDCDKTIKDNDKTTSSTSPDVPTPSLDQVRSAYEQLGIPCPESALKRLMATLPSSSRHRAKRHHHEISKSRSSHGNLMDTADNNDEGNPDHGVFDCSTHSPVSTSSNSDSDPEQPPSPSSSSNRVLRHYQQPLISSTTTPNNSTVSSRLPFKPSTRSRPS